MIIEDSHQLVVYRLPFMITISLSYPVPGVTAKFRCLGSDKVLACPSVVQKGCRYEITLPESLACHGEGRYEVCLYEQCNPVCDCIEVRFADSCMITDIKGYPSD